MEKKEVKKFTITLSPKIHKALNEGNFNKNKLINQLLKEFLQKNKK